MVFFAPNKIWAVKQSKKVAKKEGMKYIEPKLAKIQIPHRAGWKTWTSGWR